MKFDSSINIPESSVLRKILSTDFLFFLNENLKVFPGDWFSHFSQVLLALSMISFFRISISGVLRLNVD